MQTQPLTPARPLPPPGDRPRDPRDAPCAAGFELRFRARTEASRSVAFPCDVAGRVPLDALSERARHDYFYARALAGREYHWPVVRACALQ